MAGLKGVQYGSIMITNGNTSATATISAVNPAKAVVYYLGDNPSIDTTRSCRVTLTDATTITATKRQEDDAAIVNYCVAEFH